MVSIRDYAKMNNVSYEAIRQQVKRYEDELNGHIIKQNRTQFLDDVAVDILDQHRKENPVVIINQDTDSRLKQLEDENKNLLIKVAQQADKISQLNEDLKNKTEQMTSLLLENKEKTFLLEQKKDQTKEINQLKEQLDREKKEQLNQQVKQLKARKSQEERKARTKRLIEIGAAVESVLNRPIEHDELPKLIDFLKTQEQRGHFFSKAMNKDSQNYNSNNDEQD